MKMKSIRWTTINIREKQNLFVLENGDCQNLLKSWAQKTGFLLMEQPAQTFLIWD